MAGFGGGFEDDTRGFDNGFREWRARDGLCRAQYRLVLRRVQISITVVVELGDGALALRDGDGDGATARSRRSGFLGAADFWAWPRGRGSGLVDARGWGFNSWGWVSAFRNGDGGCGVGGDGGCGFDGDGGCGVGLRGRREWRVGRRGWRGVFCKTVMQACEMFDGLIGRRIGVFL